MQYIHQKVTLFSIVFFWKAETALRTATQSFRLRCTDGNQGAGGRCNFDIRAGYCPRILLHFPIFRAARCDLFRRCALEWGTRPASCKPAHNQTRWWVLLHCIQLAAANDVRSHTVPDVSGFFTYSRQKMQSLLFRIQDKKEIPDFTHGALCGSSN